MRGTGLRSSVKSVVAILCAACFLTMSLGSVSRAVAADTWETWPKKTVEPGVEAKPATDNGAAQAGDAAGKKTEKGISAGTIGWIALGVAAVAGVVIAVGSGGGSGSSGSTSNH
jgi:hypothetical protein